MAQATTNTELQELHDTFTSQWTGSCFGLSSAMAIYYSEKSSFVYLQNGESTYSLAKPLESTTVQDIVNSYQSGWDLASIRNLQNQELKEIQYSYSEAVKSLVESINDTLTPTVIAMQSEKSAHSVLLLEVTDENEDYYTVKCCDPNKVEYSRMYIYKEPESFSTGIHISYYGSFNADEKQEAYSDLYYWTKSFSDIDPYNYFTQTAYPQSYASTIFKIDKIQGVWLTDKTTNRSLLTPEGIIENEYIRGPILNPGQVDGLEGSSQNMYYYIDKDNAAEYEIKFDGMEAGNIKMINDSFSTSISTAGDGTMLIDESSKKINVKVNDDQDSLLEIVNNNSQEKYYCTEIQTTSAEELACELVDGGTVLAGDDLTDITIVKKAGDEEKQIKTSIDSEKVLLTEKNENIVILEDTDNDGEFEKIVASSKGDINGDGILNLKDIMIILKHVSGKVILDDSQLNTADSNEDGIVNLKDLMLILKFVSGKISVL